MGQYELTEEEAEFVVLVLDGTRHELMNSGPQHEEDADAIASGIERCDHIIEVLGGLP